MNGESIDRYGELMHRLGAIQAELSSMKGELAQHVVDEGADVGQVRDDYRVIDGRLKRLEELLTSGHAIARALGVVLPLVLALIGAVWAAHDWWDRILSKVHPSS